MRSTPTSFATLSPELVAQLRAVIDDVMRDIGAARHVTLAVVRGAEPWAALVTDRTAEALNDIEQSTGGPALDALWSGRIARIPTTLSHARWPEYILACRNHGVSSAVAFPISIDGARVGVMTVASNDYFAFGPDETRVGMRAATRSADILGV
jgi:hypothetical protein